LNADIAFAVIIVVIAVTEQTAFSANYIIISTTALI